LELVQTVERTWDQPKSYIYTEYTARAYWVMLC